MESVNICAASEFIFKPTRKYTKRKIQPDVCLPKQNKPIKQGVNKPIELIQKCLNSSTRIKIREIFPKAGVRPQFLESGMYASLCFCVNGLNVIVELLMADNCFYDDRRYCNFRGKFHFNCKEYYLSGHIDYFSFNGYATLFDSLKTTLADGTYHKNTNFSYNEIVEVDDESNDSVILSKTPNTTENEKADLTDFVLNTDDCDDDDDDDDDVVQKKVWSKKQYLLKSQFD